MIGQSVLWPGKRPRRGAGGAFKGSLTRLLVLPLAVFLVCGVAGAVGDTVEAVAAPDPLGNGAVSVETWDDLQTAMADSTVNTASRGSYRCKTA